MPKLRVLQIVHETLVPPPTIEGLPEEEFLEVKTEWDVKTGLEELGHTVMPLGLRDELAPLTEKMPSNPDFESMIGASPNFRKALAVAAKAARGSRSTAKPAGKPGHKPDHKPGSKRRDLS